MPRVVFMCGPAGAGKSTTASQFERSGMVRLSFDQEAWSRGYRSMPLPDHSHRDIETHLRRRLIDLVGTGHDVVLDFSFWSRAMRDDWRALLTPVPQCESLRVVGFRDGRVPALMGGPSARSSVCTAKHASKEFSPMAQFQSALSGLLTSVQNGEGVDLVRESVRIVLQELVDAEAIAVIGADRYERTPERTNERNGTRPREVMTKGGTVEVQIPKLRTGSFFPSVLERRRRIDQALYAVVMEAWVNGVSTRNVDALVVALGGTGISKSEVSRICAGLDEEVGRFRTRRLDGIAYPYVFLDATYLHVRTDHLVTSKAVVVATAVAADGRREILGVDVGDSEDEVFWRGFLTSLKARGLNGVRLVISDQHAGLTAAIRRCFQGAGHQRCRVHYIRNLLALVPKAHTDMVAALFRTIFAQPDPEAMTVTWDAVRDQLAARWPKIGPHMDAAKAEVLAFNIFPRAHWRKIWSTNPLERLNKEIKRRARVVGIFPNEASVIRLVGMILTDTNDEWITDERRYLSEGSMALLYPDTDNGPIAAITDGDV